MAIYGNFSYLRDVYLDKIKPHPFTWFVWTIVSGVNFFGQIVKGAGVGVIPTGVAESFTLLIFLYSLKYDFKTIKMNEVVYLVISLLGLIPWFFLKDPTISVIIVVLVDLVAFVPTIEKTWRNPDSERAPLYLMNVGRHLLTLLSIQSYNIATTFHSIAMIGANSIMSEIILKKRIIK